MDLDDIGDFIRRHRESLEAEKRTIQPQTAPEYVKPMTPHQSAFNPDTGDQSEKEEEAVSTMFHWKDNNNTSGSPHHQHLERRAATAGEQPQAVGESFYSYFPSFNAVKQRKLEETRKEYFEYLKKVGQTSSPRHAAEEVAVEDHPFEDLDERRRMEKERLAAQFQKSNRKSILNYQIVEERNKSVEEEAARKKQEYHDALMQQIEDRKRRVEAKRAREKLNDEIMDRKIELLDILDLEKTTKQNLPLRAPQRHDQPRQEVAKKPKANSDEDGLEEFEDSPRFRERKLSYNYFSNSARDAGARELIVQKTDAPPTTTGAVNVNPKPCCEHYKLILEKLETLCRWRDDFVAKKKGCLLCDSGNLKNCNFCDYHEKVIKAKGALEYDDSFSDSDTESMQISSVSIRKPAKKSYQMIMADKTTPQVVSREDERKEKRSSFINFDEIPLPAPRGPPPEAQSTRNKAEDDIWTSRSKLRLNEMKKVEWKWNVPAVQTHNITKDKPEKVLTQLGAIRKQLQMEQFQIE